MDEFGLNVSTMQPIQLACVKCNARGGRCAGSARQQHASGQVEVQARVLLGAWGKGARELRRENEVWLAASGAPRGKKIISWQAAPQRAHLSDRTHLQVNAACR
jgi:hypothetical protein